MIRAIISAEDAQFYEHKGLDYLSILRAAIKNLQSFEIKQGGSTITQQITKSLLLTPEKSFARKIKEAILARRIEKYLTKDEILTIYLNQIYFGLGAYGVEAAARAYFGKPASDLTLSEATLLAGLPKAPNYYSPFRNFARAKQRQNYVLKRMLELGVITTAEQREAEAEPLTFQSSGNVNLSRAPYFIEYIRQIVLREFGYDTLYKGGLTIETTLNLSMQQAAQEAISKGVETYEKRVLRKEGTNLNEHVQGAFVCMDPSSGKIMSMVGGRDFRDTQFNRVIQAKRQPGSAFKPIIYAAALDKGYTPASIIIDSPIIFRKTGREHEFWEPRNYDETFLGPITFRKALAQSRNIATIKILQDIGIDYTIKYARNLGLNGNFNRDLSLALGTSDFSLLQLVQAYASFCAQGIRSEPYAIKRILDWDGNILVENTPHLNRTMSPQTAYLMTSLLQSVVEEGTGRRVRALSRPCAGKTGTTNEFRDAWFIGFTPQIVAGAWVGFDDGRTLGERETGGAAAGPIWLNFMQKILGDTPVKSFQVPKSIVFVRINPETGYFPSSRKEKTIFECFKEGTIPTFYRSSLKKD
jgi:penicillin-binding protein 1A